MKSHILILLALFFAFCSCTETCPTCKGHKKIKYDTGESDRIECYSCHGTGRSGQTCRFCDENGMERCISCEGLGYIGKGKHKTKCKHCDGRGKNQCWGCFGTTIVNCQECRGQGYTLVNIYKDKPCPKCNGNGFVSKF